MTPSPQVQPEEAGVTPLTSRLKALAEDPMKVNLISSGLSTGALVLIYAIVSSAVTPIKLPGIADRLQYALRYQILGLSTVVVSMSVVATFRVFVPAVIDPLAGN